MKRNAQAAKLVLAATILGGACAVTSSLIALAHSGAWASLLPFLALAIAAGLPSVHLLQTQHERWTFNFHFAVLMAAVAMIPDGAPLVGLTAAAVVVVRHRQTRLDKVLFNLGNLSLATGCAALVYTVLAPEATSFGLGHVITATLATVVFYVANTGVVSLMISLHSRTPLHRVAADSLWSAPINSYMGLTGAVLGGGHSQLGVLGTALFGAPLAVLLLTLVVFSRKSQQAIETLQGLNDQLSGEVAHRAAAEAALSQSEAHLRAVLDNVAEGILTVDEFGRIETCNPAAEQVFGYPAAQVIGRLLGDLVPSLAADPTPVAFGHLLQQQRLLGFAHETLGRRRDESSFPIEVAIVEMWRDQQHRFVVSARDITERQQAAAALEHQALHDALTGLPNRTLLHDRLQQQTLQAQREGTSVALLVMDLDRFKEVNDTLGHYYGDLLLRELGQRLQNTLRSVDTVARLGGDEFAVLLPRASAEDAAQTAQRLIVAVEKAFNVGGHPVEVGASVGIAICPDNGTDPGVLLRRADVAMYVAKRNQLGVSTYSPDQDQHSPDRLALMAELRAAIEEDQLELHYQPKVDFATGTVSGAEALVRWRHPQRGLVPPDEFIPLAEQSGQVKALSRWVLDHALRQARQWSSSGLSLGVAVNLSMRDLHDPALPDTVASLLARWQVDPATLTVEITESTLMADPVQALEIVRRLSRMGVHIAIDDFGTGYSSLAYLKRLPVDELKVDRAFVRHIASDSHDAAIVRSTIGLAHDLGLSVVAEGIEDQDSWNVLHTLGCDRAQGYFVSRPLAATDFTAWLANSTYGLAGAAIAA